VLLRVLYQSGRPDALTLCVAARPGLLTRVGAAGGKKPCATIGHPARVGS